MIAYLCGKVLEKASDYLILVTAGGVGYRVFLTGNQLNQYQAGLEAAFYTYLSVKEDGWSLYGFSRKDEKKVFELFLKVSGVGPKVALSILACLSLTEISQAMGAENADLFTKVPGIGKKTAQRIVLELKDKIEIEETFLPTMVGKQTRELMEILTALGYSNYEAKRAVEKVLAEPDNGQQSVEELVPKVLKYLAP